MYDVVTSLSKFITSCRILFSEPTNTAATYRQTEHKCGYYNILVLGQLYLLGLFVLIKAEHSMTPLLAEQA